MVFHCRIFLLLVFLSLPLFAQTQSQTTNKGRVEHYKKTFSTYHFLNPDSALYFLREGQKEFTSINDRQGLAEVAVLIASVYNEHDEIDSAQHYFTVALALSTNLKNETGIASASNGLGVIEGRTGHYAKATKFFLRALHAYEHLSDTDGLASCYIKLGKVNYLMNNTSKAIEYYEKGLALGEKKVDRGNMITLNNNLGGVYLDQQMSQKALPYFLKALSLSDTPQFAQLRTMPLINIGTIKKRDGDNTGALSYYLQAQKIALEKGMPVEQVRTNINISNIILSEQPDSAYRLLQNALSIAYRLKDKSLQEGTIESLVDYYRHVGDFKSASNLQQTLALIKDTLYSVSTNKEISTLQALHELDVSNQEITKLEAEKKERNIIKTGSLAVGALSLAFAIIVLVLNRKTRNLNFALSQGKARLQYANDTKDKLFSIIGHDLKGPINSIHGLLGLYREASPEEKEFIIDSIEEMTVGTSTTLETLLNWGKSQIKGITFHPIQFLLHSIVDNKVNFFNLVAKNKNIHIANNVPHNLSVTADIDHVRFVMRNLLANAIKFSKNNGVIEVNAFFDINKGAVCCSVKDNGVGIEREKLDSIFEPFNESIKGTGNEVGHGIGLLLAKEFINENGGKIWVESVLYEETTFFFTLPGTPVNFTL